MQASDYWLSKIFFAFKIKYNKDEWELSLKVLKNLSFHCTVRIILPCSDHQYRGEGSLSGTKDKNRLEITSQICNISSV